MLTRFGSARSQLVSCTFTRKVASSARSSSFAMAKSRSVLKKIFSPEQPEGEGAVVRRSIGSGDLQNLDPFLMLDYFTVSAPAGFPDHPHRGFETVTYMLEGAFTHQDFAGHKGTIKAGDLQWMTAGKGIVHSEMPASAGVQRGLQLWVNLSSKYKMIEPNYQELECKDIPVAEKDGIKVKVIAGESLGTTSSVYTRTPTMFLDVTMEPGAKFFQPIPQGWNAFVYTLQGKEVTFAEGSQAPPHHTLLLGTDGEGLSVENRSQDEACKFVLIAGQPIGEPVYKHGPFVMNTRAEIMQAIRDYQRAENGFERAISWTSDQVAV